MFAIIQTGGKQYRAEAGMRLRVEKIDAEPGTVLEFDALLLGGEKIAVGAPTVPGARVVAEVMDHGKLKKILVMKYKAKIHYRRKKGHRQQFTHLMVKEIIA